jgi:quercetin dioxygenase-like cupin family protein
MSRVATLPHPAPEPAVDALARDQLTDIALGLARSPLWRAVAVHDADGRRPVRLLATDAYEVWVIGWLAGQGLELHDHGASAGLFTVVEGRLEEVELHHGAAEHRSVGVGGLRWLPPGTVHGVANELPSPATSIHVYSPPLTTMGAYASDGTPLRTEPVEPVPALLSGGVSVLRHPSLR